MIQWWERIERKLADYHATLPHLPEAARQWLTTNIWWIVLIGAAAGLFVIVVLMLITLVGGVFLAGAVFLFSAKYGGLALLAAALAVALMIANVVILGLAITPLKSRARKGWVLLMVGLFVGFIAALVIDLVRSDDGAVLKDGLLFAVSLYAMFELRGFFTSIRPTVKLAGKVGPRRARG